ncbi:MAG: F0F1 ATP synthase subunit delta [Patescibacteria group bacterium]
MTVISNNDIARAVYLVSKDKSHSEQVKISIKVVEFLSRKRLLSKSSDILSRLSKIINKAEGRVVARVSSVEKLDHKTKLHISHGLKKRYSAEEVIFQENIDSKLIGGLRIQVNDEIIDTSIKNKIGQLQEHLTKSV